MVQLQSPPPPPAPPHGCARWGWGGAWWGTHPRFGSASPRGSFAGASPYPNPFPLHSWPHLACRGSGGGAGGACPRRITRQSAPEGAQDDGQERVCGARSPAGLGASPGFCVRPPKVLFCQRFSGGGLGRGKPQRSARGRGARGVNRGRGDWGLRRSGRLPERAGVPGRRGGGASRGCGCVCRGAAPRGDLGGGAARRGGRARSSTGVCGGRENPFVADRSRSGLRQGRGRPSPARPSRRRRRGPSSPPDRPEWLSALTQAPREEAGKVLVARKVRAARVSHPRRSLTPPAPQLSLLLMQNLGRGWGRPRRQWPWLEVCQETAPGQAGSLLPTPHPSNTLGGREDRASHQPQPHLWNPCPDAGRGAEGGGKGAVLGSPSPRCYPPREWGPGGPAPNSAHPGELFPHIFYPHTAPLPPS